LRLVGLPFAQTFTLTRAVPAPVRAATGRLMTAEVNQPRIDHAPAGARLGLLIEAGETLGQADRCAVAAGDWEIEGRATVLHEYADLDGTVVRRAYYTREVRQTANACLRIEGHHRLIGALQGFLPNRNGQVLYRERSWAIAGFLDDGDGAALAGDGAPDYLFREV